MDNPLDVLEDDLAPPAIDEATLLAIMERVNRKVTAGLTVPLADVPADLDAVAERVEARLRPGAGTSNFVPVRFKAKL